MIRQLRLVVLVDALSEAPPVRQEVKRPVEAVCDDAFVSYLDWFAGGEVFGFVVASNDHEVLQ